MRDHSCLWNWLVGAAPLAGALVVSACAVEPSDVDRDGAMAVMFEGTMYTDEELFALGVAPVHYLSTRESARDGYAYAFASVEARDLFASTIASTRTPVLAAAAGVREQSRFFDFPNYQGFLLALAPGESVADLNGHPCQCADEIGSLKASQTASYTVLYDHPNFDATGGTFWIDTGAELPDLTLRFQPGGANWYDDVDSIKVLL